MEEQLSLDFLRVVENAAIAAARTMGYGDRHHADEVAVEAMRKTMDSVEIDGTIVIGEGERDEAPMLYIGEKVGLATHAPKALFPQVDIAVDPLEGTNLCATGAANAIAVLAASDRGGLLHAPDLYMEKLVVGPSCKGAVDLDAPVADNLKSIAKRLERDVEDLVVVVLDRPRHEKIIADIRAAGARIRLIGDGDLSAGISSAVIGTGGRAYGGGAALLEWADSGAAGGEQAGARGAAGKNGSQGYEAHLRHRGPGARQENDFRVHRRDGWKLAERRAVLRGRHSNEFDDPDAG